MVGLGEGARYLVEYPYGCAEQKGSPSLALLLAADLGDAFTLPGMDPTSMRPAVQRTLKELERFQCESGGFAYWPGDCWTTSPYLTAYLLHVFKTATDLKYDVDRRRARPRLRLPRAGAVRTPPDVNEAWWPSYTAWQAFAVKVLVEGGRNQDSNLTRLYGYRDRMPVFALAYLHDAMLAKGEIDRRPHRRSATTDVERDPARGRQRARRGARRSVPALVLELERALDRHRAELARQGGRAERRRSGRWSAG